MFCKNCGTEVSEEARFCPKCGTEISGEKIQKNNEIKEDGTVKFQLKPKFNWGYKFITVGALTLLWVIIIAFWLSESLVELLILFPTLPQIVIAIVAIYIVIKLIFEKLQYDALEYP